MIPNPLNKTLNFLLPLVFCLLPFNLGLQMVKVEATPNPNCSENIEELSQQLLRDLPNYANRMISSSQPIDSSLRQNRHIIVASQPELDPLPLPQRQYTRVFTDEPTQIFFTTLERIYSQETATEVQSYHWLFLVKSDSGWRFLQLLSSQTTPSAQLPTPPRESNESAIAQGIRRWLTDCQFRKNPFVPKNQ